MIRFDNKMKTKLKKLGVGVIYLIGSRAMENARANSDFDFAVVMKDSKKLSKGTLDLYHKLYQIFSDAVPDIHIKLPFPDNMIEIDIVFLQTAPLYYSIAARDKGKVLYEISPLFRADYEEQITNEYMDFEPLRREQETAILSMI